MTTTKAHNRLWEQFVKQLQIVAVTLFLMLQFIWLIFRGNLGTLRMLAEGANRFSQGDHAVRIEPEGAPEVRSAAEAFNNMANNIESLLASLGKSESKNKLLATIVEQSSEAIWTKDLSGTITSWNSGAAAMFGYPPAEAHGPRAEGGRVDAGRGSGAHAAPGRRRDVLLRRQGDDQVAHGAGHPGRRRAAGRRRQPVHRQDRRRARRHAAQAQRGRAAPGARSGGSGQPREELVPRHA